MAFITVTDLGFRYTDTDEPIFKGLNLTIEKGSYTAVLGHNGSGKSTLARLLCGMLTPDEGKVTVAGYDTADEEHFYDIREKCAMIFQNPDNQLVAGIVEEDVAFAPENLGCPREEIRKRVDEALAIVGMTDHAGHAVAKLSGGQKQRVAIAGVLAMKLDCIIFDEATSMLDPSGRKELIAAMKKLNKEQGITVVTITHYMNEAVEADRVIVLDHGKMLMDGTPKEIFSHVDTLRDHSLAAPQVTELLHLLNKDGFAFPAGLLHTEEAADALQEEWNRRGCKPLVGLTHDRPPYTPAAPALELKNVSYIYSEGTPFRKVALDHVSIAFPKGEVIGVIGHTGSGKSTMASLLNGLLEPSGGQVLLNGEDIHADKKKLRFVRSKVGLVFQYPEYQLFEDTVAKDIAFGPKNMGLSEDEIATRVEAAAKFCGISERTMGHSPFEISGGQKRRAAIAGIVAMEPEVLVLDEPAAGLDPAGREDIFGGLLEYRNQKNATLLLISHSMEEVARYADRILVLKDGKVFLYGTVEEVFSDPDRLAQSSLDLPQITKLFAELKARGMTDAADVFTVPYAKKRMERLYDEK